MAGEVGHNRYCLDTKMACARDRSLLHRCSPMTACRTLSCGIHLTLGSPEALCTFRPGPVRADTPKLATMALSMRMRANARVVSGRRVAAAPRIVPFSSVASPVLRSSFAPEVAVEIRRAGRTRVVVEAVKKSVGDLGKADLEGEH